MIRICFVCSHLYPCSYGGAELRYYLLARELAKMNHEVLYITYSYEYCDHPFRIVPVGKPPKHYDERGRRKLLPVVTFGFNTARILRRLQCDIVDISVPYTPGLLLPQGSFILTIHEFWGPVWRNYYGALLGGLVGQGEKWLVSRPKAILTPSEFVAERIKGSANVPVYSVPIGLPLEGYTKYARNAQKDIDVVAIGRFTPIKGWNNFVKLLKLVDKSLKVAIIGDGPLYSYILKQISNTHHRVEIRRRVNEIEKISLLSRAKYYLNLSLFEGFSIATLEAIICGAYPIVFDSGYNAAIEVVQNTGCGFIIKDIKEAIEILTTDPPKSTPRLSYYTLEAFVKRYLEVLKMIYN
jgi:glycosyltransferase involved in cell wall biosynthesis